MKNKIIRKTLTSSCFPWGQVAWLYRMIVTGSGCQDRRRRFFQGQSLKSRLTKTIFSYLFPINAIMQFFGKIFLFVGLIADPLAGRNEFQSFSIFFIFDLRKLN